MIHQFKDIQGLLSADEMMANRTGLVSAGLLICILNLPTKLICTS